MSEPDAFESGVIENLMPMRAFAHMLARDRALAEDLVHDTVIRALAHRDKFQPGTNLKGWLAVIMRNVFFQDVRRRRRKGEVPLDQQRDQTPVDGGQEVQLEIRDFRSGFQALPPSSRQALALVGIRGCSYEQAAALVNCPVGTIKSRVSRARLQLRQAVEGSGASAHRIATVERHSRLKARAAE